MEHGYVYVSGAFMDREIIKPYLHTMRKNGISLWCILDFDINNQWSDFVIPHAEECTKFLFFISKEWLNSTVCKQEVEYAVSQKKEILCVYIEDSELVPSMRMHLAKSNAVFRSAFDSQEAFCDSLCQNPFFDDCRIITQTIDTPVLYDYATLCRSAEPFDWGANMYYWGDSCAYKALPEERQEMPVSQVQFSAISPKEIQKGNYAIINIAMYEERARSLVDKLIAEADAPVKEVPGSTQVITAGTKVEITLTSSDIALSETETQDWHGHFLNFSFCAEIPKTYEKSQILFTATVYFNDVIATRLRFTAQCMSGARKQLDIIREDVLSAFMSYASLDRPQVASLIMGMKKARPDMDIFFDVENLRSGERWETALRYEIEKRDILFLCWSQNAKDSQWVDMEWHYALENKGLDAIEPIPLVSPAQCPPPAELSSKHFNDKLLLYTSPFSLNVDDL